MALNVLIGGGTGFVGRALIDLLKTKGHSVTVVSRQGGKRDRISWSKIKESGLPSGTNAVINLSGAPVVDPSKRFQIEEYKKEVRNSRIHTTQWLTKAIAASSTKPDVWISASGIGFYPTSETAVYDEDSPGGVDEYMSLLAKEWEGTAKLPENCTGVREVIVRMGVVLGKDGGVISNMRLPYIMGLGGPIGNGKQYFPWIHLKDAAGIFTHAIENKNVQGILNAVSPEIATNNQFSTEFAKSLNRPAFFRQPEFMIRCMLGEDWSTLLLKGQNAVPKRTLESGYEFKYPNLTDALNNL